MAASRSYQRNADGRVPMPRQNRVTPFGEIIAIPERGTFLGNRGVLHDAEGHIKRAWKVKRWLVCVLDFRGRKRAVMTPNRYTELFFLDESDCYGSRAPSLCGVPPRPVHRLLPHLEAGAPRARWLTTAHRR